jgi:hypothetical protein
MTNFDDHLWSYLVTEHGAARVSAHHPDRSAPSRRALIVRGTAGLAAATGATVLVLSATTATPRAFALTRHHDGSVTVKINSESGIAGANRALDAMGIRARIRPAAQDQSFPTDWSCTVIAGEKPNLQAMRADASRYAAEGNEPAAQALRAGAKAIAAGAEPDVVYNCTISGSSTAGPAGNTGG